MLCKNGNMNEEPDERLWQGFKGKGHGRCFIVLGRQHNGRDVIRKNLL